MCVYLAGVVAGNRTLPSDHANVVEHEKANVIAGSKWMEVGMKDLNKNYFR